ncbi:hypothetical protein AVEN_76951-1 [Araneus ventricosus]|uniref:Uncharacterized protein n=1 Tax=Araneus ventricosus TaxID=182803 RepID=A0A4Y2JDN2_ARAVE|nr:hypothetical protein AVEN_76951-1 [Araneus ventricosus]
MPTFQVLFVDNFATIPPDTEKHILVRACLATEPAYSPGADHPPLRLVLLLFITGHNSVHNFLFPLISEQSQTGHFSLALVFNSQFERHPEVELKR